MVRPARDLCPGRGPCISPLATPRGFVRGCGWSARPGIYAQAGARVSARSPLLAAFVLLVSRRSALSQVGRLALLPGPPGRVAGALVLRAGAPVPPRSPRGAPRRALSPERSAAFY